MTLGDFVKTERIRKGQTQKAFADECGVTIPTLISIENKENYAPTTHTIGKILTVCGLTYSQAKEFINNI